VEQLAEWKRLADDLRLAAHRAGPAPGFAMTGEPTVILSPQGCADVSRGISALLAEVDRLRALLAPLASNEPLRVPIFEVTSGEQAGSVLGSSVILVFHSAPGCPGYHVDDRDGVLGKCPAQGWG